MSQKILFKIVLKQLPDIKYHHMPLKWFLVCGSRLQSHKSDTTDKTIINGKYTKLNSLLLCKIKKKNKKHCFKNFIEIKTVEQYTITFNKNQDLTNKEKYYYYDSILINLFSMKKLCFKHNKFKKNKRFLPNLVVIYP